MASAGCSCEYYVPRVSPTEMPLHEWGNVQYAGCGRAVSRFRNGSPGVSSRKLYGKPEKGKRVGLWALRERRAGTVRDTHAHAFACARAAAYASDTGLGLSVVLRPAGRIRLRFVTSTFAFPGVRSANTRTRPASAASRSPSPRRFSPALGILASTASEISSERAHESPRTAATLRRFFFLFFL